MKIITIGIIAPLLPIKPAFFHIIVSIRKM
jgi:hypothetical protein